MAMTAVAQLRIGQTTLSITIQIIDFYAPIIPIFICQGMSHDFHTSTNFLYQHSTP